MSDKIFHLEKIHLNLNNSTELIFWGYIRNSVNELNFFAKDDNNKLEIELLDRNDSLYNKIFRDSINENALIGLIKLDKETLSLKYQSVKLKLYVESNSEIELVTAGNIFIDRTIPGISYSIENIMFTSKNNVIINGWLISNNNVNLEFKIDGRYIGNIKRYYRKDICKEFPEIENQNNIQGFEIDLPAKVNKKGQWSLVFKTPSTTFCKPISKKTIIKWKWKTSDGIKGRLVKAYDLSRSGGTKKAIKYFFNDSGTENYQKWIESLEPDKKELDKERLWEKAQSNNYTPKFSIVVPIYKTPKHYLGELIKSVKDQTYSNWELVLADAGADNSGKSINTGLCVRRAKRDDRIKYFVLPENKNISDNTNAAIQRTSGDWLVFADHDDIIAPFALYKMARAICENKEIEYIYSDEDKIDGAGKHRYSPNFKPDYNPELLNSMNYISHLSAVKRTLIDEVGMLNPDYSGAQDYDFTLRCVEKLKDEQVYHIPEVLYHWRCHQMSTASNQFSKRYAFDAGRRAVQAHVNRIDLPAEVTEMSTVGRYKLNYNWNINPMVSIIIPNKDHAEDLKRCIDSIEQKTAYTNYEIIVVENNSTSQEIYSYYNLLASDKKVKVVKYEGGFNYSKINNFGILFANGDYYVLLNNDIEVITPEWLTEMLNICIRDDVGIVGAKLLYPDNTIQHAGVILGIGGVAGHAFKYLPAAEEGYMSRAIVCQDYSAVTAACLIIKKEAYDRVGGLSTDLAVAFNDVDLCLKVRKAGYRIAFTPFAKLYHYESKSRGQENTPEKIERFNNEIATFNSRWGDLVAEGDPCYNIHLSLKREDFSFNEELKKEDLMED